jgi:hypothetical protein
MERFACVLRSLGLAEVVRSWRQVCPVEYEEQGWRFCLYMEGPAVSRHNLREAHTHEPAIATMLASAGRYRSLNPAY